MGFPEKEVSKLSGAINIKGDPPFSHIRTLNVVALGAGRLGVLNTLENGEKVLKGDPGVGVWGKGKVGGVRVQRFRVGEKRRAVMWLYPANTGVRTHTTLSHTHYHIHTLSDTHNTDTYSQSRPRPGSSSRPPPKDFVPARGEQCRGRPRGSCCRPSCQRGRRPRGTPVSALH